MTQKRGRYNMQGTVFLKGGREDKLDFPQINIWTTNSPTN